MKIIRATVRWSGFPGAPGYSNFHFGVGSGFFDGGAFGSTDEATANSAYERVAAAFDVWRDICPGAVNFSLDPEALVLDSDTGETLGAVPRGSVTMNQPTGTGAYSGPSGAVINWNTADYRFGRRVRGRTFLVPLANTSYEADGTLTTAALSALRSGASELQGGLTEADFGVWSRPRGGSGGVFATVTGHSVPDKVAVLRSRRD